MLNAFWRVAPSDRFRLFAMFAAGLFCFAIDFNVRTCSAVHARLFFTFFMRASLCMCANGWNNDGLRHHVGFFYWSAADFGAINSA